MEAKQHVYICDQLDNVDISVNEKEGKVWMRISGDGGRDTLVIMTPGEAESVCRRMKMAVGLARERGGSDEEDKSNILRLQRSGKDREKTSAGELLQGGEEMTGIPIGAIAATEIVRSWCNEHHEFTNLELRRAFPQINYPYLQIAKHNLVKEGFISVEMGRPAIYKVVKRWQNEI